MNDWYHIEHRSTHQHLFARTGFGADGSRIAIYDYDRSPLNTGLRLTAEEARQQYRCLGKVETEQARAIEARFTWELHR